VIERIASGILPVAAFLAVVVVALIEPRFLSAENLLNVVRQASPLAVFTLAQTLPLLTRGLDLSQGGVVVVTSVCAALLSQTCGAPTAFALALLVGTFSGLCCGTLVAVLRVTPLIVTLGMGSMLSGLALVLSNGQPVSNVATGFSTPYYAENFGVPLPILVVAAIALALSHLLRRRAMGKYIQAVGSNERAARLSGVPVRTATVLAYALCGALTSLGAVLLAARISSGHPTVGADTSLQAIAAAVIGGVSLFGGRGSVLGALIGAVFLGLLSNALNLLNVSSFSQMVAIGAAIVIAVIVDRLRLWNRQ
jgi:ribose transport system permease protein